MSMGVNSLNNSKWSNVDMLAANKVTEHIFNKANKNATIDASSISKLSATRQLQGVDFYSRTTSIEAQREISIANSGMNAQALASANQLNNIAALSAYNTSKAVEGKLYVNAAETKNETLTTTFGQLSLSEVFKSSNDTKGSNSNPFFSSKNEENENKSNESLNILG